MAKVRRRTARVMIGQQRWTIHRCKVPDDRGGDCNNETKTIRVSHRLAGIDFVTVLLHELIHARWWCLCESEVKEFAEEAAAVLESFGVTDQEDTDG